MDKHLSLDSARAWWERPSDPEALKQVVAEHLMRDGRSYLATLYCREAGVTAVAAEPYEALHAVIAALRTHDVAPALSWLTQHRCALAALTRPHQQSGVAALEFALHRQHFLMLLQREGHGAAVAYARSHFQRLDASLLGDWQRLMGALLYAGRLLESPYSELLSESAWERAVHLFTRECCALLGTASESPLAVVVDAGTAALPTLVKMTSVVAAKGQSWQALQQLPLEVALPPRLAFHSVFACPVAREQSSPDNPPMILPCGLVLCKQSIQKLARGSGRLFKCPYCPVRTPVTPHVSSACRSRLRTQQLEVPVSACKPVFF